jgi:hypothetical protein
VAEVEPKNPTILNTMSKTLTDQELRTQLQTLDHDQLRNYLFQVVRQLEKYQEQELTEKERDILEKLQTEKVTLERKLAKLIREKKASEKHYVDLNKKYNSLEQERIILSNENQTLKKDQKAAIRIYNKLKIEKEAAEQERNKAQENFLAIDEKANN